MDIWMYLDGWMDDDDEQDCCVLQNGRMGYCCRMEEQVRSDEFPAILLDSKKHVKRKTSSSPHTSAHSQFLLSLRRPCLINHLTLPLHPSIHPHSHTSHLSAHTSSVIRLHSWLNPVQYQYLPSISKLSSLLILGIWIGVEKQAIPHEPFHSYSPTSI